MTHAVLTQVEIDTLTTLSDQRVAELFQKVMYHMHSHERCRQLEQGTPPHGVLEDQFVRLCKEMLNRGITIQTLYYRSWDGLNFDNEYLVFVCS